MSATIVRAAVSREKGSKPLRIEDLFLADPGPEEVRVRIAATAVCGSDLAYLEGAWEAPRPAVFGHESSGIVEAVGEGVDELAEGDRVVVTLVRSCGRCRFCSQGRPVACAGSFPLDRNSPLRDGAGVPVHQGLGVGGFASGAVVHFSQAVKVPTWLELDRAALLACGVLTGVGAVLNTAAVPPGAQVVVLGCGGVGLNVVQGARLAEAKTITVFDPDPAKLGRAIRFGATHSVKAATDLVQAVSDATRREMADYVFVATSSVAAVEAGFDLLAPMGGLVLVGMPATGAFARLDVGTVASLNQRVLGSKMGSCRPARDIPRLVDHYRKGRLELEGLISGRYPFTEVNRALDSARRGDAVRNLVVMEGFLG